MASATSDPPIGPESMRRRRIGWFLDLDHDHPQCGVPDVGVLVGPGDRPGQVGPTDLADLELGLADRPVGVARLPLAAVDDGPEVVFSMGVETGPLARLQLEL